MLLGHSRIAVRLQHPPITSIIALPLTGRRVDCVRPLAVQVGAECTEGVPSPQVRSWRQPESTAGVHSEPQRTQAAPQHGQRRGSVRPRSRSRRSVFFPDCARCGWSWLSKHTNRTYGFSIMSASATSTQGSSNVPLRKSIPSYYGPRHTWNLTT